LDKILEPVVLLFKNILVFFNTYLDNWGLSIIILTLLIKVVLFPTTLKQFRAMDKMKKIQPKLKEIQDKFKDKPEELQRRTMELYKKEEVNPFGSCLPTLLQIPILFAMYYLLSEPKFMSSLIQDSHFLWFSLTGKNDLILAALSGLTTFYQQKLTTPASTGDANQQMQMMLYIMPAFLAFITYTVSAGVGLYWVASNIIGIGQQYLINEYFVVKEHHQEKKG
jgi:YidC/Oxa1 family membrane protein insertase